jgi:hypothetical protein
MVTSNHPQIGNNRNGGIDRNGETDALGNTRCRMDGGAYADHLSPAIEQRTTGIARIDRRIRLYHPIDNRVGIGSHRSPKTRDRTDGHGPVIAEWISNRHNLLPYLQRIRGSEHNRFEQHSLRKIYLNHGQVVLVVLADQYRIVHTSVMKAYTQLGRIVHDMRVGEDIPVLADHNTRTGTLDRKDLKEGIQPEGKCGDMRDTLVGLFVDGDITHLVGAVTIGPHISEEHRNPLVSIEDVVYRHARKLE